MNQSSFLAYTGEAVLYTNPGAAAGAASNSFPQFPQLAPELRNDIWGRSIPTGLIFLVEQDPTQPGQLTIRNIVPRVMAANREARGAPLGEFDRFVSLSPYLPRGRHMLRFHTKQYTTIIAFPTR